MGRSLKWILVGVVVVGIIGFLVPAPSALPVRGADRRSYDQRSFWYHPWGKSVTHKGVDVFARTGTSVLSASPGLVVFTGVLGRGGNVVLVLGPKWRLHYYAHLREIGTSTRTWLGAGEVLGTVGTSGNAVGKQPHLHYSIMTLVPYPWQLRSGPHGWRRMWYVDPTPLLNAATSP
jgi:murein DD-endopeptidase MepM/ murein hydrolase activator NlpD